MRLIVAGVLVAVFAATAALADGNSDTQALAKTASGFYDAYMTLDPSDGIPDPAVRAKFVPYVSPALDRLLVEAHAAEDHFAKATRYQSPPLVEGDLFTSNFEGATSFRIDACADDASEGHCAVTLIYDNRKDKPVSWTDTVYLVHTPMGWRVDDIAYGGNWDFGNKGRLTTTLKDAIANGNAFSK